MKTKKIFLFAVAIFFAAANFSFAQIQWTEITPPAQSMVIALAENGGTLYAATEGDGVFKSTNQGDTWTRMGIGLSGKKILSMILTPKTELLVSTNEPGSIYTYSATKSDWEKFSTSFSSGLVTSIATNKIGNMLIAGASSSSFGTIYRYKDGSGTWTNVINSFGFEIQSVHITPDASVLFSAFPNKLYRIAPDGSAETKVADFMPLVFYTTAQNKIIAEGSGLNISVDNGANWTKVFTSTDPLTAPIIADPKGNLYAVYYETMVISDDGGINWTTAGSGLGKTSPIALVTDGGENIFAATYNKKFYRGKFVSVDVDEQKENFLHEAFPNPADDFLNISLNSTEEKISVEIFTIFGESLRKFSFDGKQNILIPTSQLPSGAYYYQISAGEKILSQKFQILH